MSSPINQKIIPEDITEAARIITNRMQDSGNAYVTISRLTEELITTGLQGQAGAGLLGKVAELRQMGEAQVNRASSVADQFNTYGQISGQQSAEAALQFGGIA